MASRAWGVRPRASHGRAPSVAAAGGYDSVAKGGGRRSSWSASSARSCSF